MPQRKTLPTEEQEEAIKQYIADNKISPIIAGRIAWDRLLAAPAKPKEIKKATLPRGTVENLKNQPE
jgi:hypothetical protein